MNMCPQVRNEQSQGFKRFLPILYTEKQCFKKCNIALLVTCSLKSQFKLTRWNDNVHLHMIIPEVIHRVHTIHEQA